MMMQLGTLNTYWFPSMGYYNEVSKEKFELFGLISSDFSVCHCAYDPSLNNSKMPDEIHDAK